jgi:hypothetical protein
MVNDVPGNDGNWHLIAEYRPLDANQRFNALRTKSSHRLVTSATTVEERRAPEFSALAEIQENYTTRG